MAEMKLSLTSYVKLMTDDEILKLLEFIQSLSYPIRMIFLLLIYTGIRVGEACSLKRENIQNNRIVLKLEKSNRTHERILPDVLQRQLYDYMEHFKIKEGWLFPTSITRKYNGINPHIMPSSIACYIKKFRDNTGLKDSFYTTRNGIKLYRISTHTIRHWNLCKMYELTKDIALVADIIGHIKIGTTYRYIRSYMKKNKELKIMNCVAKSIV